jgi:hypothetical protein
MLKLSFVEMPAAVDLHAPAVSFLTADLSEVDLALALDQFEVGAVQKHVEGEVVLREELVAAEKIAELRLTEQPDALGSLLLLDGLHPQNFNMQAALLAFSLLVLFGEGYLERGLFLLVLSWHNKIIKIASSSSALPHSCCRAPSDILCFA